MLILSCSNSCSSGAPTKWFISCEEWGNFFHTRRAETLKVVPSFSGICFKKEVLVSTMASSSDGQTITGLTE